MVINHDYDGQVVSIQNKEEKKTDIFAIQT